MLYALKSMASALSVFMRLFSSKAVSINDSNTVQVKRKKMTNMRDGGGTEKEEDSNENTQKIMEE